MELIKDEESYLFYETRDDFQVIECNSQAHRASGSENYALSAKTKSKTYRFLRTQQQVLVKPSLTARRATRRAQKG